MEPLCRAKLAPFEYTLSLIQGKWKMRILYELGCEESLRYGQLKRNLTMITHKMLSSQLKELEKDGLLFRQEFAQIPPKVIYSLTDRGRTLFPVLDAMCEWGKKFVSRGELSTDLGSASGQNRK